MSRLFNLASIVSLSTLLALAGVTGALVAQGRLSGDKLEQIATILRGEEIESPEHAAPASAPAPMPAEESHSFADDATGAHPPRHAELMKRASLERARQDLLAQQRLVDHALAELVSRQETFDQSRQTWKSEQQKLSEDMKDEGFERELQYVSKLSAKQGKEHVLRMWRKNPADAVRLFNALKVSTGQQILAQFKSADELDILHELLEQIREQDVDRYLPGSRTTSGG